MIASKAGRIVIVLALAGLFSCTGDMVEEVEIEAVLPEGAFVEITNA